MTFFLRCKDSKNHKKNTNKFMLFLQIESSNQEANQIMDGQNKKFGTLFNELNNNLDEQTNSFKEKMKLKRMKKNSKEWKIL